MEHKHTPGEWRISGISQDDGSISIAKEQIVICYVTNAASFFDVVSKRTPEAQFANARLIAAAPELLEAAKLALSEAESYIRSDYENTKYYESMMAELEPVRAAIAKAIGGTQP